MVVMVVVAQVVVVVIVAVKVAPTTPGHTDTHDTGSIP